MDNLKEFKAFLKTIPSIKEDVLNHRYTWQEIYEIYTMYGEDDHFFKPYKEQSNRKYECFRNLSKMSIWKHYLLLCNQSKKF